MMEQLVTILDEWAPPSIDGFFLYYPSCRHIRPALKRWSIFFARRVVTSRSSGEPLLRRSRDEQAPAKRGPVLILKG